MKPTPKNQTVNQNMLFKIWQCLNETKLKDRLKTRGQKSSARADKILPSRRLRSEDQNVFSNNFSQN